MIAHGHTTWNALLETAVLAWCARNRTEYRVPAMREHGGVCRVIDATYINTGSDDATIARGADWTEVAAAIGVYGPQFEAAPVKQASPVYTSRRRYGRR